MKSLLLCVSAVLMTGLSPGQELCPGQEPADPEWIGPRNTTNALFVAASLPEPGAHGRAEALLAAARAALAPWTNATVRLFEVPGEGAVVFAAPFVQGSYRGPADESHPAEAALLRATRSDAFPTPTGGARPVVARGLAPFDHRQIGTNWITRTHWPEETHLRVLLADARGAQATLWHAEEEGNESHAENAESAERKPHAEFAEAAEFSVLCIGVPCLPEELPETLDELVAEPYANLLRRSAPLAPRDPFGAVARAVFGDRGVVAMAPLAPGANADAALRAVRAKALDLGETTPRFAGDPFVAVRAFAPPRGADRAAFARDLARELLAEAKVADRAFNWPEPFFHVGYRDSFRRDRSDSSPWNWRKRDALRAEVVRRTGLAETLDAGAEPIEAELVPGDAFRLLLPDGPVRGDFTLRLSPEHAPAGEGLALAALVSDKKNAWEEDRIVLCDPASPTGALRTALFPEDPKGGSVLALVWSPRPDADFTVYGACPDAPTPQARRDLAQDFLANPAAAVAATPGWLRPFALRVRHRPGAPLPPRAGAPYDDLPLPPPPLSARALRDRDLRDRGIPDPERFAEAVRSWAAELRAYDARREPPDRILGAVSNRLLRAAPAFDPAWDEDLALGRALREAWGRKGLSHDKAAALFARALDAPPPDPLDAAVAELVRAAARALVENAGDDPDAAAVRVPDLGLPPALARSLCAELAALRLERLWLAPTDGSSGKFDNAFRDFLNGRGVLIVNGKAAEPSGPTIDDLFREAETPAERLALRVRFLRRVLALPDLSAQYAADNWNATWREYWGRRKFVERMVDDRSGGKPLVEEQPVPWLRVADYVRDLRRAADAVADVRVPRTVISPPRVVGGVLSLDEGPATNRVLCPIHAIELDEARRYAVRDMGDHAGHAVASDPPEFVEAFARDLCRRAGIDDPDEVDMFVDQTDGQAADWATFGGEYGKGPYSVREGSPLAGHYARTAARRAAGRATFGKLVLRGEHAPPPPPEAGPPPPADDNGHVEPYPDPSPALRAEMARYGLRAGVFVQRGRHSWNAGDTNRLSFLFFEPTNAPAGADLPLLLFLPGSGELGPGLDAQFRQRGIYEKVCSPAFQARHPCFLLALAPDPGHHLMGYLADGGPNDNERAALNLVAALAAERDAAGAGPRVDLSRLYGAGLSRGAGELVCIQQEVPGVFAAVATTDTAIWQTDRIPDDAPLHIWHFYRPADWEKWRHDVRWLRRYADLLPSRGGEMRITELTDLSHASWDQAWACDEMWDWMFAQRRALPLPDWNAPRDPEHPMWKVRRDAAKAAAEDGPMAWTQWPVPWPADETTFHRLRTERRKPAPDRTAEWKAWLAERGVRFPDGSRIRHLPFSSDLLVYATPADHRRIHALLAGLEANPFDPAPENTIGPSAAPPESPAAR